jgi:two-component system sensor histidine kinase CpxA
MKSLYRRILAILAGALILCLLITFIESVRLDSVTTRKLFEGSISLQLQQAQRAYEEGGPQRLAAYMAEVDATLPGQRFLTDSSGKDLVSGTDRSGVMVTRTSFLGPAKDVSGQVVIVRSTHDGKYHLVVIVPPPIGIAQFIPYLLLVTGVIALFGWWLAAGIASPLRRLASAVESFGKGDLAVRVRSERRDEIGELARSFDAMADRIATLLTAERRLLQDVSHELRSPIARLSFAAELMKNAPDPEAAGARMKQEIKRLTQLVSSLLEVTSAEGDPSSRVVERFEIAKALEPTLDDCAFEAEARRIRIRVEQRSSPAVINGDPELLRRAVENVLRNAIRYAPEGSDVEVKIDAASDRTRISIRDCGPGVPEDALPHIFEAFYRADASRDPGTGNVGLGLAIARRALRVQDGKISAENAHPGLLVRIDLPGAATENVRMATK